MHSEQPGFSSWASSHSANSSFHCISPQNTANLGYNMYAAILAFILPAFIIMCFYVAIAIRLRKYHRNKKELKMKKVVQDQVEVDKTQECSSLPSPRVNMQEFFSLLMDKLSLQCESCKGCIVVTEEIFMEIEKEKSQDT